MSQNSSQPRGKPPEKNTNYGMLCLTFKLGESVTVGDCLVTVVKLKNNELRLAFNAPKNVKILRTKKLTSEKY